MLDRYKRGAGPVSDDGVFELYRWRAEQLRRAQAPGPRGRLRAPRGVAQVRLLSGIHQAVVADGTVDMTEADAEPLLRGRRVRVNAEDHAET
jgi:hypothetical protein